MKVSDLLAMNFCQEYSESRLLELFGDGDFTWREIVECDIPTGHKVFCLLRPEFMIESDIRMLATSFLARASFEETENYSTASSMITSDDIREVVLGIYKIERIHFKQGKKLSTEVEWLLSEIVKCLQ